ncbi:hypothetical protein AVT17_gp226 [Mycobacterium phage Ariel]|nr:hypothetical protein AVT17_gp226 [Mycobacterium phage Ariel]AIM50081.1 hypothetical protein PBI_ARIEL_206 [Mycobacterium phage Ariel]
MGLCQWVYLESRGYRERGGGMKILERLILNEARRQILAQYPDDEQRDAMLAIVEKLERGTE